VHLYYEGICHICGKHEPQPWSWLEVATMFFIFGFIAWAVFVVLILAHWRNV